MAAAAAGGLRKLWLAEPHNKYGGGWRLMAAAPMSSTRPSFLHPHLSIHIHAVSWRQQKSECLLGLAAISANSPSLPFVNVTFTEPILRQTMPLCSILTTYTALLPCALSESAGFVNPGDVQASIFVFYRLHIGLWNSVPPVREHFLAHP